MLQDMACLIVDNHLVRVTVTPNMFHFIVMPFFVEAGQKRSVRYFKYVTWLATTVTS
jgi:hypothetical protein